MFSVACLITYGAGSNVYLGCVIYVVPAVIILYCFLTLVLCWLLIFYAVGVTTIDASQKFFCSVTALVPAVYAYCELLLTVFVNALLATLLGLAVTVYSLHIGYSAWYNTSFGVIYMLCLIDVYCTQANVSLEDTHLHHLPCGARTAQTPTSDR
jgi:sterol desaturase/sphingolipid hydroxylase (fatty acid hydroxylase superfamily)